MKRIAIGGIHTECSSYSPLHQTAADFTRIEERDLLNYTGYDFAAREIEAVPLFHDRSVPGGPVSAATFAAQKSELLGRLAAAMPLDGVLLLLHGALFVPDTEDPEAEIIEGVRAIVGEEAIIAAAFDLHGQISARVVDPLDAFAAYRTAPHVDVAETFGRAAKMLADAINGGYRPKVCRTPVPLLVPGEMSSTFVEPCASLYAALPEYDANPDILAANLMIGYVWADSPRATAAAVVTATEPLSGRAAADQIAMAYWRARERLNFDMETLPLAQALDAVESAPAILADSGDNPTAGGVGDRAEVLEAVLERGLRATFAGISDPMAFELLSRGSDEITLGGSLGGGGPKLHLNVDAISLKGDCAVAQIGPVTVVIAKRRRPFHNLTDFENLGIDLEQTDLLVVKSGYLSPDLRKLPRRQVMALTGGAVSQDLSALENNHRPRPTWPFQK